MSHPLAAMNRSLRFLALWGVTAFSAVTSIFVAAGCSHLELEESEDELNLEPGRTKDNILSDNELLGIGTNTVAPTADQIQKLLEKTPHSGGIRSVLADKKITIDLGDGVGDVRVADAIYNAAKIGGINPLALLVRLQMEQGLVGTKTGQLSEAELDRKLSLALGCGCPHAPICQSEPQNYTGFYQQVSCAVRTLKQHLESVRSRGQTGTGWGPGIAKVTQDNSEVTPENAATAVLYTYTPFAGQDFGGEPSTTCKNKRGEADYCSGNALHTWLWDSYATAIAGTAARDGGTRDATVRDSTVAPTPTTPPTTTTPPPPPPPPQTGECQSDQNCSMNDNGHACQLDYTCGCFSNTDCPSTRPVCDFSTSRCKAGTTTPPTNPPINPPINPPTNPPIEPGPGGFEEEPGVPQPPYIPDAGFPLFDAGLGPGELTQTTPPATAPRPADDPNARPAPGATPGDLGYSTNNPYGDNTSYTDGGKSKKKKKPAKEGGCSVTAAGAGGELPNDSFFLVAGVAAVLASRRKNRSKS